MLYLLLILFASGVGAAGENSSVIKQNKACATGCTSRGNCNGETGKCECPWGYTGDACEVDRMAACRQTSDDPGSCGILWPKHCECYSECSRLYCHMRSDSRNSGSDHCAHELGADMPNARCWLPNAEYGGKGGTATAAAAGTGASLQRNSFLPDNWNVSTTWFRSFPQQAGQTYDKSLEAPTDLWGLSNWSGNHTVHPLSACPNNCSNGRGVCFKWNWQRRPECMCHKGYNGTDCSQVDNSEACWFSPDCGGRGTCRSGFCHCQPGYFGVGCHRSQAFQPATPGAIPDVRIVSRLKIYMYDLPWHVAFPYEYNDGHFSRDPMYSAYESFMKYFLQDNVVRTENPYEANLFYVPMLLYFYVGNVRDPVPQAAWALRYVRENWPFYNRTGGRDHFFFLTGDRGTCHVPRWMQDGGIKLVHFGMQHSGLNWGGVHNKEYACVQVKRDLVIPPLNMFNELLPAHTRGYYERVVADGGRDANRTLLFFFAGGVGDGEYSGGTRKAIKQLLDSLKPPPPDVLFMEGRTNSYRELLLNSTFCISPYGFGWGLRVVQAIEFGCIPVLIQDHVFQPFEDFMPYEEFAVRMPLSAVPRMVEVLRSYSEEQLAALRLGMAKYYKAFIWNREYGGQAYEWTLVGLERRLTNLQADFFHHHHHRHHHRHRRRLD
ncbi:hypothetical protein Agub_g1520 [Astrephomene gubernaculifera]|uniref:EGF-like domain-containing protein n=1 Tax=Astrephomene gubernaculifera TaxID=47775 RepID=A0AAD3DGK1_9CHLO|nr:hypothetical protein Agub_g1520 [Astrephomene gubernaculifera]